MDNVLLQDRFPLMGPKEYDFLEKRDEMLHAFLHSEAHGNVVGVCSDALGPGMFVTCVDEILLDDEPVIVFREYDISGYILKKNKLKLSEIKCACPFKSSLENPYLKKIVENYTRSGQG